MCDSALPNMATLLCQSGGRKDPSALHLVESFQPHSSLTTRGLLISRAVSRGEEDSLRGVAPYPMCGIAEPLVPVRFFGGQLFHLAQAAGIRTK